MTREEYIKFANALKNNYTIDFDKLPEFCDMAISALFENKGEWIRMGEAYVCSRCSTTCACTETADKWIWHTDDKFCRGCGAMMDEKGGGE